MAEYDLVLDVPVRAIINANLVYRLEKGGTLLEAKKEYFSEEWAKRARLDPLEYSMYDHSLAISLLYCTIVVPRELLSLPANHEIYRKLDAQHILPLFRVRQPPNIDVVGFMRLLRHSVAHALFSIRQDDDGVVHYSFWTEKGQVLEASITGPKLMTFIGMVGLALTDAVLAKKKQTTDQRHEEPF